MRWVPGTTTVTVGATVDICLQPTESANRLIPLSLEAPVVLSFESIRWASMQEIKTNCA